MKKPVFTGFFVFLRKIVGGGEFLDTFAVETINF